MTRRTTRDASAAALLLALTLTGCASAGPGDSASPRTGASESAGAGATAGADGGEGGSTPAAQRFTPGPVEEYLQLVHGEPGENPLRREVRIMEEAVAACMAEQGFDYIPVDPGQAMGKAPEAPDVDWGTREFAERYGYGVTTNPFGGSAGSMPEQEFVDPNAQAVEAMSDSEREAWFRALQGDPAGSEGVGEGEGSGVDWTQHGCQGRAQQEVGEGAQADPAITSLQMEMEGVLMQVRDDPRMDEVTTAWVDCMGDAGITGLTTVEDAPMRFSERANAVYEETFSGDHGARMPSEEHMAGLEAQVQERLREISAEEIETAVADADCRAEVGYDDVRQRVSHALQQDFVDTHREELDAWVEAVEKALP